MTGQDFQDKVDALVVDLQTKGKGQLIDVIMRGSDNAPSIATLSSNPQGVVNAAQLAPLQTFVNTLKPIADAYETARVPVDAANEAFKTAQAPHEALMTAATNARKALNDALDGDAGYQTAKTALDAARADAGYISAVEAYKNFNLSENYGNLGDAKGKYQ